MSPHLRMFFGFFGVLVLLEAMSGAVAAIVFPAASHFIHHSMWMPLILSPPAAFLAWYFARP